MPRSALMIALVLAALAACAGEGTGELPVYILGDSHGLSSAPGEIWGCDHFGGPWRIDVTSGAREKFAPEWAQPLLRTSGFWGGWCAARLDERVFAGFFWGLAEFDRAAEHTRHLSRTNGLASNQVLCMRAHAGKLYCGCENGLSIFDPAADSFTNLFIRDGLGGGTVADLSILDGTLWMATSGGLTALALDTRACRNYGAGAGLPSETVTAVHAHPSGIWIGTSRGAARFDPAAERIGQVLDRGAGLADAWVTAIACGGDSVWIGTYAGLHRYERSSGLLHHHGGEADPGNNHIEAMHVAHDRIWMSAYPRRGGVFRTGWLCQPSSNRGMPPNR